MSEDETGRSGGDGVPDETHGQSYGQTPEETTDARATTSAGGRSLFWPIMLGTTVLLGVALVLLNTVGQDSDPPSGVGVCWAPAPEGGPDALTPVSCDDDQASYRISAEVATPEECPGGATTYLEREFDQGVWCLEEL